jgi:hypothetical protein
VYPALSWVIQGAHSLQVLATPYLKEWWQNDCPPQYYLMEENMEHPND